MADVARHDHVRLLSDHTASGAAVHEEVAAVRVDDDRWRLLATPRLALGVAAGDLLQVTEDGSYEVVERGGNIAVAVGATGRPEAEFEKLIEGFTRLGGWLDARTDAKRTTSSLLVFTVPFRPGVFPEIQRLTNDFVLGHADREWYYMNVYADEEGGHPLNWWNDLRGL
jgi:hypothetical protein